MAQRNIEASDLGVRDVQGLFCRALHHRTAEHKAALQSAQPQKDAAAPAAGAGVNGAGRANDPVGPVIVPSSVFFLPGDPAGPYQYARWSNPTWTALEEALSILEDAESVIFPSGMAAEAAILCSLLKPGDRVLLPSDAYYTTRALAERYLAPAGVSIVTCPSADFDRQDFAGLRLVWIETPSNPGLDICDIRKAAAKGRQAGATVIVDNTTATPLGQRPIALGADAVVSSDTKAINGHSDVVFGHLASRDSALIAAVRDWRKLSGAIPGPVRGLARSSRPGDSGGALRSYVQQCGGAGRSSRGTSQCAAGEVPGTCVASWARCGKEPNAALRHDYRRDVER